MMDAVRLRGEFLARLDVAMRDVPHGVATEVRAGIVEELEGLDATATAERIGQLGDPTVIAREAAASDRTTNSVSTVISVAEKQPLTQSRGFAIAAALVLAFGGFLIPVAGWFVGVVMVFASSLWRRWEKFIAVGLPLFTGILLVVVSWLTRIGTPQQSDAGNPLILSSFNIWHSGVLVAILIVPISGAWLLWRLKGR